MGRKLTKLYIGDVVSSVGDRVIRRLGALQKLAAPTISIDGDRLTITDESGLAESFDILVDGVVKTSVKMPDFRIVNKLDGSWIGFENGAGSKYYYEFEGGTPTAVTLNGETSTTGIETMISENTQLNVNVAGKLSVKPLYNGGNYAIAGVLQCNLVFHCGVYSDSDDFVASSDNSAICFAAGTLILTPQGYKAVETFAEGDSVCGYNLITNSVEADEVVKFHLENGATSIRYISFENGTRIGVTATHSFMTDSGWKCCEPNENTPDREKLNVGDYVQTVNNTYTKVTNIEVDTTPQPVYHLSLVNNICLAVSDNASNEAVLAEHNMDGWGISTFY